MAFYKGTELIAPAIEVSPTIIVDSIQYTPPSLYIDIIDGREKLGVKVRGHLLVKDTENITEFGIMYKDIRSTEQEEIKYVTTPSLVVKYTDEDIELSNAPITGYYELSTDTSLSYGNEYLEDGPKGPGLYDQDHFYEIRTYYIYKGTTYYNTSFNFIPPWCRYFDNILDSTLDSTNNCSPRYIQVVENTENTTRYYCNSILDSTKAYYNSPLTSQEGPSRFQIQHSYNTGINRYNTNLDKISSLIYIIGYIDKNVREVQEFSLVTISSTAYLSFKDITVNKITSINGDMGDYWMNNLQDLRCSNTSIIKQLLFGSGYATSCFLRLQEGLTEISGAFFIECMKLPESSIIGNTFTFEGSSLAVSNKLSITNTSILVPNFIYPFKNNVSIYSASNPFLLEVFIPNNITTILGSINAVKVVFPKNITKLENISLSNTKEVVLPKNIQEIKNCAFNILELNIDTLIRIEGGSMPLLTRIDCKNLQYIQSNCKALSYIKTEKPLSVINVSPSNTIKIICPSIINATNCSRINTSSMFTNTILGSFITTSTPSIKISSSLKTLSFPNALGWSMLDNIIIIGEDFDPNNFMFDVTTVDLGYLSLLNIFTKLKDNTGIINKTLKLGAHHLVKLTDSEKEIATNKNWTLV